MGFKLKRILKDAAGGNSGFTLVELLIVVAIIGILAAAASFSYMHSRDRARVGACKASLGGIKTAMEIYHSNEGKYPPGPYGSFDDLYAELGQIMNNQQAIEEMTCDFVSYDDGGSGGRWYTLETTVKVTGVAPINVRLTESIIEEW